MQILDPKVLIEKQAEILEHAETFNIQEVKIFGKHIGQNSDLQGKVNFLIVPSPTGTTWHQRVFKAKLDQLLGPPVEIYTEFDLNDLVRQEVITINQKKEYMEEAITLTDFNKRITSHDDVDSVADQTQLGTISNDAYRSLTVKRSEVKY